MSWDILIRGGTVIDGSGDAGSAGPTSRSKTGGSRKSAATCRVTRRPGSSMPKG